MEIDLFRPTPELSSLLSARVAAVLPRGEVSLVKGLPIGSGPFVCQSSSARSIVLSHNALYFAGRPFVNGIVLQRFAGAADEANAFDAGMLLAGHEQRTKLGHQNKNGKTLSAVASGEQNLAEVVVIGAKIPSDIAVNLRRVIDLAVNREALRKTSVREPATAFMSAKYDPAAARAIIASAPALQRSFELWVDASRPGDREVGERLVGDLSRVGLMVRMTVVDPQTYETRAADLSLGLVLPAVPEGSVAALALLAEIDPSSAREKWKHGKAADDSRAIVLFHRAARLFYRPSLRGLRFSTLGLPEWSDVHLR